MPGDAPMVSVRRFSLRLSIAVLWPLVVLAGFGVYVSLVPLVPNDFWWHLKIGEIIHTQCAIPTTNMFAWSLPAETPFFYGAWLGEWLLYIVYTWGGLALLLFVRTILALSVFWLTAFRARLRSDSWRLSALALAFAGTMSLNNLMLRPQIWSWLPFVIYLLVLESWSAGRLRTSWLLVLPLLMVFWVNAHGAFVLGLVLLGIFGLGELLSKLLKQGSCHSWSDLTKLVGVAGLTSLATLINPKGVGIVQYVIGLMTDAPSQGLVIEWQSPTPSGIANTVFYISIVVLLLVLAYSKFKPPPTDILLLAGFLWLAWNGQRYVIWFGLAVMPILTQAVRGLWHRFTVASGRRNMLNTVLSVVLFVPVLAVQSWWVESVPLPDTYWSQVWRGSTVGSLIDTRTPLAAAEYLEVHPGGHLFNEMGYGSYLIWALPKQGVFVDPRVELYPYDQWLDYALISRGVRSCVLLNQYAVDRVLLDRDLQDELSRALYGCEPWSLEYEDDYSQIWIKHMD
jgi:hypothetical protein